MQLKFKCMAAEDKGVEVSTQYIHKSICAVILQLVVVL